MRKILSCTALLISFVAGDGAFNAALDAQGGGGSASGVKWIGTLGGMSSQAYEVSSNGSVLAGYSSNPSGSYRAFRWTATTGMT